MKVHTGDHQVLSSGAGDTTEFRIKSTAKAFLILSSSLYSDKALAPVRELSCNARDAHTAAGKLDTPFEIKLPNDLDNTFAVKDYGPGLSHQDVITLYTTYFESTKTDSDDYIGALGLGSKSPFAYTNRFTVESRHGGAKRIYTTFLNERGVPAVTCLSDEPSDEPTGLTISFTVRRGDEDKFYAATRKALTYFTPQPLVTGLPDFRPHSVAYTVKGNRWAIRTFDPNMSGAYVIQGVVAYPIDRHILVSNGLDEAGALITKMPLDLFVGIGDAEVAPSREALSYDERTVANLIVRIGAAVSEFRDSIQAEFDKCKTLWDARILHVSYREKGGSAFKEMYNVLSREKKFTFLGAEVSNQIDVDMEGVRSTGLFAYYLSRKMKKVDRQGQWLPDENTGSLFKFELRASHQVVVDDIGKGATSVILRHMQGMLNASNNEGCRLIVIRPTSPRASNQAEINQLLASLGDVPLVKLSSFNYEVAKKYTTYKPRAKGHCLHFSGFPMNGGYRRDEKRRVFSRLTWETVEVDFNDGGYFMPLERFSPMMPHGAACTSLDDLLRLAMAMGALTQDDVDNRVFGFSDRDIAAVRNDKGWCNLFTYLEQFAQAKISSNEWPNIAARQAVDAFVNAGGRSIISVLSDLSPGAFKSYFHRVNAFLQAHPNTSVTPIEEFLGCIGMGSALSVGQQAVLGSFTTEWSAIRKTYPMIDFVKLDGMLTPYQLTRIVEYVAMVDHDILVTQRKVA